MNDYVNSDIDELPPVIGERYRDTLREIALDAATNEVGKQ